MTSIVDECAKPCLLHDGQSTLYDSLPPFDDELARDVTVDELSLAPPGEPLDDHQGSSGSSLPATPAERPCTFCPSSLPLPPPTCTARATLVLDLDGTLISSEELNAGNSAYLWNTPVGARTPDYEAMGRRVWLRPGVREFLAAVRPHFEIILFTAATQNWAAAAIEQLDPLAELFDVMLHRDHTTSDLMWDYVKDLSRLGRDLSRVVIVDDNPLMFMYQPDNALHIGAYEASTAGGPDNVLPRVAEVLINQVAAAIDVREVLGPMACAKSCISSTVSAASAAQAAAEPHDQTADAGAACAIDGHDVANAVDCNGTCSAASSGDGEGMQCDAPDGDRWGLGTSVEGQLQSNEEQQQLGQQGAPTHSFQLENTQPSSGLCGEDESNCTLSSDAEKGIDWDGESEGAETFDEHGAAAQLGADVSDPCQRNCSWESSRAPVEASEAAAAEATGPVALAQESGENEESDACPPEEHSVHTSEDFEALMDDAMAEYDSDAYEGSYGSGTGYDYACPAETAVPAVVLPESLPFPGQGATGIQFGGSSCCDIGYPISSSHLACGRQESCADNGAAGQQGAVGLCVATDAVGFHAAAVASAVLAERGSDVAAALEGASSAAAGPALVATMAAPLSQAGSEATGHLLQCSSAEDAQRQPQLPTGMVFLMDLNPAFGAASSDGSQTFGEGCDADAPAALPGAVDGDVSLAREVFGCKRVRSEAEADGNPEADGARGVVARLSCEGTPHSTRLRVADGGIQA